MTATFQPQENLGNRAALILNLRCSEHDTVTAAKYISPNAIIQHDDEPPTASRDAFFANWTAMIDSAGPDGLRYEIKETCVDEQQRKVWVLSEVHVRNQQGRWVRKASVDMMRFDEQGVCVESADCQRIIRDDEDDEEEER